MQTFIALLRGINVSGQKKIRMADLKKLFEALGYRAVQTYIQSGNVVFRADTPAGEAGPAISGKILDAYGFEVDVLIRRPEDLGHILDHNPFLERGEDPERLYVTFLAEAPAPELIENLRANDYSPEAWQHSGQTIYFFSPLGYGRAKMNNNFFEKKLRTICTTRNWRTVQVLYDMSIA